MQFRFWSWPAVGGRMVRKMPSELWPLLCDDRSPAIETDTTALQAVFYVPDINAPSIWADGLRWVPILVH